MDIKEIINQRYAMPDASLDRLRQCLTEVSYPKGFRVLESGKIEKDIFFIKKGIVRAYTSSAIARETIIIYAIKVYSKFPISLPCPKISVTRKIIVRAVLLATE